MKKEVLRIRDLSVELSPARKLSMISLNLFEGERVGFLGLTNSGKDLLVLLLEGALEVPFRQLMIYGGGKRITGREEIGRLVYRLAASNYIAIGDWTAAEYIGLADSTWLQTAGRRRSLIQEIQEWVSGLGLQLDVSRKMAQLSEYEKRLADVVKARRLGKKLLIIEDSFEGVPVKKIGEFAQMLRRLCRGMGVIINTYSNVVLTGLSERYIIFRKGTVVKKCGKEYLQGTEHLEQFLQSGPERVQRREAEELPHALPRRQNVVYRIRQVPVSRELRMDFEFRKGEVTTILALDPREKEALFYILSGRKEGGTAYYEEGGSIALNGFADYVRSKIVSVIHLGSSDEVFRKMSVEENLVLPSLEKMSSLEYICSSRQVGRMAHFQAEKLLAGTGTDLREMEPNDVIRITLERWYLYNPQVLLLLEPFQQCDVQGVAIVKSYIRKFAARGTAVVVVKSREEYMEKLSTQLIRVDEA